MWYCFYQMSKCAADAFLDDFKSRSTPSVWPKVNKDALILGLRARVNDPNLVKQAGTPFCGPASLIRTVASDNPDT